MVSLALLAAFACQTGSGKVDQQSDTDDGSVNDDSGSTDSGSTDSGEPDDEPDDDTGDPDPTESVWAGLYEGEVSFEVPAWTWLVCVGPAQIVVDTEGALEGSASCVSPEHGVAYPLVIAGTVDGDGRVTGDTMMEFVFEDGQQSEFAGTLYGFAVDDQLTLGLETQVTDDQGAPFISLQGAGLLVR